MSRSQLVFYFCLVGGVMGLLGGVHYLIEAKGGGYVLTKSGSGLMSHRGLVADGTVMVIGGLVLLAGGFWAKKNLE